MPNRSAIHALAGARGRRAFSLVELLVVIAVIAILAALLLPSLSKAKQQAYTAACQNNLRQLMIAVNAYVADNNDVLPANNYVYDVQSETPIMRQDSWAPGLAPFDRDTRNIESGLLFPYLRATGVYRCPADKSPIESTNGIPVPGLRTRSYNMSQSINSAVVASFRKFTEIRNPSPANCMVFIDVHEDAILDSLFGIALPGMGFENTWFDIPANRHNQGACLAFADGHVEKWRWKFPKSGDQFFTQTANPADQADFSRLLSTVKTNWLDSLPWFDPFE